MTALFSPTSGRHVRRLPFLLVAVLTAAILLPAGARAEDTRAKKIVYEMPGPLPLLSPEYLQNTTTVLLTDDRLSPRRVTLEPGQTITWRSFARDASHITFEREVARSMICHGLVNFSLVDDELRSGPLATGDVASFCELAPGEYRYRVVRQGGTAGGLQLSNRLEGIIVVRGGNAGR